VAQVDDEGRELPTSSRPAPEKTLAPQDAAVQARHVGVGASFTDEHQATDIEPPEFTF
jgi:hypothetical protein